MKVDCAIVNLVCFNKNCDTIKILIKQLIHMVIFQLIAENETAPNVETGT